MDLDTQGIDFGHIDIDAQEEVVLVEEGDTVHIATWEVVEDNFGDKDKKTEGILDEHFLVEDESFLEEGKNIKERVVLDIVQAAEVDIDQEDIEHHLGTDDGSLEQR